MNDTNYNLLQRLGNTDDEMVKIKEYTHWGEILMFKKILKMK